MRTIDFLVQELPKFGGWPDGAVAASFLCSKNTLSFSNENGGCPSAWRFIVNCDVEDRCIEVTREQYEAALAAKNDGWIEWGGGECPVPRGTLVDVRYRNGEENHHVGAGVPFDDTGSNHDRNAMDWEDDGSLLDIIAYRLHQPQEEEQAKADDETDLNERANQDAAAVWNGEGLPPVGCECEVSVDGGRSWCTYRAINEKNGARLIEIGNFTEEFQNNNWVFRPIRSGAERKRQEAVKTIMLTGWCQAAAEEIYDLIAAGKVPGMKLED